MPMTPRDDLLKHFGSDSKIVALRRAPGFGSHLFVLDLTRRTRPLRLLGSIDRHGSIIEQSAMDRLRPERLVFGYERLMMNAFAMVPEPRTALLLGLGGGAMSRHLAAFLPNCAVTIVEREPVVRELARSFFHIRQKVVMADAQTVVGAARRDYDVILVDLYDSRGTTVGGQRFWRQCRAALRPGGCLAVNWAELIGNSSVPEETERLADVVERSFFLAERVAQPNIVQFVPTVREFRTRDIGPRMRAFASAHRLPREIPDMLKRAKLLTRWNLDYLDEDD
jgi:spermidine synthase